MEVEANVGRKQRYLLHASVVTYSQLQADLLVSRVVTESRVWHPRKTIVARSVLWLVDWAP